MNIEGIKKMTNEEKDLFIQEYWKKAEEEYKKEEKIAAKKIVAIIKESKVSLAQIEWILRYVYDQLRNNLLNFE